MNNINDCSSLSTSDFTGSGVNYDRSRTPKSISKDLPTKGIDFRDALNILSSRTSNENTTKSSTASRSGYCGCVNTKSIPPELKDMGQTIDLFADSGSIDDNDIIDNGSHANRKADIMLVNTNEKQPDLRESLKDLPNFNLIKMVLKCQEDRVKTFSLYDHALKIVLLSRNISAYQAACLTATAAFAVLSDTVISLREEISDRINNQKKNGSDAQFEMYILKSIMELQDCEREKLQLTAGLHLEQIRMNDVSTQKKQKQLHNNNFCQDDEVGEEEHDREVFLLKKGVSDLQFRIESCKAKINDIMEDMRFFLMEIMESDDK